MFLELGNEPNPKSPEDVPLHILVPAFVLNELSTAFMIGVMIFIPFIIIDLIVSSVLLSIGIIFLPPVIVSLPIKIILFVLVDGWNFLVEGLIKSFT
jgi:flagellar biosynthetic protein FliP